MANKYKKGDLVEQVAGGPKMAINALPGEVVTGRGKRDGEYHCRWFRGATEEQGFFGEHLLKPYVPPK